MADKKISALTAATTPLAGTEVLPIVQSGATVKAAVSDLTSGRTVAMAGATISGLTATRPVFTDGSKNLTSSGTVPVANGGTGSTTASSGGVAYASSSSQIVTNVNNLSFDGSNLGIRNPAPTELVDAVEASGRFVGRDPQDASVGTGDVFGIDFYKHYGVNKVASIVCDRVGSGGGVFSSGQLSFWTNSAVTFTARMTITATGNIYPTAGTTGMTDGFFYIPAAAGAPTNAPTAITGRVPMYYDTTNNEFYVYNGAWKKVALT